MAKRNVQILNRLAIAMFRIYLIRVVHQSLLSLFIRRPSIHFAIPAESEGNILVRPFTNFCPQIGCNLLSIGLAKNALDMDFQQGFGPFWQKIVNHQSSQNKFYRG
jgi:hypothetical protein